VTANLANVVTTDLFSVSSAVKVTGPDGQGVLLGGLNISGNPENVYEGGAIPVRGQVGMDVPIFGTVTANVPLSVDGYTASTGVRVIGAGHDGGIRIAGFNPSDGSPANLEEGGGVPICSAQNIALPISGTVTANLTQGLIDETGDVGSNYPRLVAGIYDAQGQQFGEGRPFPISGTVTANLDQSNLSDALDYFAINYTEPLPVSIQNEIFGTVTIGSLPAISGTVTANTFALQGTAVTTSNFTSTTASTLLANFNATREVLTIFNEGAGNLHICAGATCTTIAYQVRLSSGDYYEVPNHQTSLTHSAVFATAGTARIVQIS
jgi:GH24 family phage-related lysozyme (muramidase)